MSLIKYSALTTKIRAMEGKLIDNDGYIHMSSLSSVGEAVGYIARLSPYRELFSGMDLSSLHRADIEKLLLISKYNDYAKLYRFANARQRDFLSLYFKHYELLLIRRCLHECYSGKPLDIDLKELSVFFKKHSRIDIDAMLRADDMKGFVSSLAGSDYAKALSLLDNTECKSLFDYELVLDQSYFKQIWNHKKGFLSEQESADLKACTGTGIDILNLQWIYRSKKYYNLEPAKIYTLLLPYYYKLKRADIDALVGAATLEELSSIINSGYYKRVADRLALNTNATIAQVTNIFLTRIYNLVERRHPYSSSSIISYLYQKEREVNNITQIIEAIRYSLTTQEILDKLLQLDLGRIAQ